MKHNNSLQSSSLYVCGGIAEKITRCKFGGFQCEEWGFTSESAAN